MTQSEALQIYDIDSRKLSRKFGQVLLSRHSARRDIARYIADALSELFSENGVIQPNGRNYAILAEIERQLPGIIRQRMGVDMSADVSRILENRLKEYDIVARKFGWNGALLGDNIAQFDAVRQRTAVIAQAFDRGSDRATQRIQDALTGARYSIERGQGLGVNTLRDVLISHGGVAPQYAGTVSNSMMMSIDRSLTKIQCRRAGLEHQRYTGQVDKVTREFCLIWVGQVKPVDFWDMLQNDVGPQPASEFGGGWNCRHRLLAWNPDWDLR